MNEYPCPNKLHEKIRAVLSDLDTMPFVYRKLLKLLNSSYVSSRDLGTVISTDPSLSIRVLRMVNSAYYGMTQKVMSVNQAVNLLGLNVVRSLCFCLASYDTFFSSNSESDAREWARAMRCGLIAKHLSRNLLAAGKPEELFIAGVLHDVGYSILKKYAPKDYKLLRIGLKERTDLEAERRLIGTTHAEIGALACQAWRLPDLLVECVRCHHDPVACTTYPKAAAVICLAAAWSRVPSDNVLLHPHNEEAQILKELGLEMEDLQRAMELADREQTVLEEFLEVHY